MQVNREERMNKVDHDNQSYNMSNHPSGTNPYQSPPPPPYATQQHVPNYLIPSIIATICCCMPFGIPAIVFSAQANGKRQAGDYAGALESSGKAKLWMWLAFGIGFLVQVLWLVFYGAVILNEM